MRKRLILSLFTLFALAGCNLTGKFQGKTAEDWAYVYSQQLSSQQEFQPTMQDNDFELKKRCSEYVDSERKRIEEKNNKKFQMYIYSYGGTFWSKARNTCITVDSYYLPRHTEDITFEYTDAVTGLFLDNYRRGIDDSIGKNPEKLFELVK